MRLLGEHKDAMTDFSRSAEERLAGATKYFAGCARARELQERALKARETAREEAARLDTASALIVGPKQMTMCSA